MKKHLAVIVASSFLISLHGFAQEEEMPINPTLSSGLRRMDPPESPEVITKSKKIVKSRPFKSNKPVIDKSVVSKPSAPVATNSDAENLDSLSTLPPQTETNSQSLASTKTRAGLPKINMSGYVELDESIKNEPYEGSIDFPDAELTDILKAISKLADKNFILDNSLKGKRVSVLSPQKVTKEEAYNVFLTALFMNGLTLVSSGKFLRVIPSREAPKSNVRVFYGDFVPASDEIVTLVYPLKNISSEDMPRIFQDLLPRTGNILVYPETNSVVMTDSGLNLRRMISILKSVDVPGSQPKLESIPINYASAKDIAKLVEEILDAQAGGSSRRSSGSSSLQKVKKIQGGGVITKIVPDDRTNSLVVLANGKGIEQLRSLVAKLDSPNASNSGNIHIYFIKNAVAEELATTLNNLLSASSAASSSFPSRTGINPPTVSGGINPYSPTPPSSGASSKEGFAIEGQIKVVADKPTNSLVVRATSSNFEALKQIIEKLDIPRRQVNVEATIMEIRVRDSDRLNIAANLAANGIGTAAGFIPSTMEKSDFAAALSSPAAINGIIGGLPLGKFVTITGPKGESRSIRAFTGFIQAIQDLSLGQILQQPNILTSDNEAGVVSITEGIKVEAESTTTTDSSGNVIQSRKADKVDVALELKVTPQIGEDNDLVKLKVEQTMTDYNTSVNVSKQIDTISRKANTTVVVRNGDTIVIGGLEKNDLKSSRSKVPLLGDLPILGNLFRGSSIEKVRSNLMLFLTPKIIRDNSSLLELTKMKLEGRQKTGRVAYDPKDFHRKNVSLMLRDTSERLEGKDGWGFKKNTSAYIKDDHAAPNRPSNEYPAQDDVPQDMSLPEVTPPAKETPKSKKENTSSNVNDSLEPSELLPAPKELNLENNSAFDDLDVR
jgi:general secretion pathway protein D